MGVISRFYEKIFYFFATIGTILIVGGTIWLFCIFIPEELAISVVSALVIALFPALIYMLILGRYVDKIQKRQSNTKNTYKLELCSSLDGYAYSMPFWVLCRFIRYFNSIPEYVYASDNDEQSVYKEIKKSTSRISWIMSNNSVKHSIYFKESSDRRSEMIDAVKNTLKEETKVVKGIKKKSEQYHQSIIKKENNESRQRHSRSVDEFLDEYYAKEKDR